MAVRTKRLGGVLLVPADNDQVVYVCPEGRTAIVKDMAWFRTGAVAGLCEVYVIHDGVPTIVEVGSLNGGAGRYSAERFVVLLPGDELKAQANDLPAGAIATFGAYGAELDGVAE